MADTTWHEYVERSGIVSAAEMPMSFGLRPRVNTNPLPVPPDIMHLRSHSSVSNRPSLESLGLGGGAIPKMQQMLARRSLKTPGLRHTTQQLSSKSKSQDQGRPAVKKRASVELIAEQYRAMLDYKDRLEEGFGYDEDELEADDEDVPPPVPRKDSEDDDVDDVRLDKMDAGLPLLQPKIFDGNKKAKRASGDSKGSRGSSRRIHPDIKVEAPRHIEISSLSPQSDGTLVAFEEDAIYFKPISFGPSPPASPISSHRKLSHDRDSIAAAAASPSQKDSRQLDIGLDLLNTELSHSLARGPRRPSEERTSDLQLSIMIDAYENLRERARTLDLAEADRDNVARMFDSWVSTLHTIRGSLGSPVAGNRPPGAF